MQRLGAIVWIKTKRKVKQSWLASYATLDVSKKKRFPWNSEINSFHQKSMLQMLQRNANVLEQTLKHKPYRLPYGTADQSESRIRQRCRIHKLNHNRLSILHGMLIVVMIS